MRRALAAAAAVVVAAVAVAACGGDERLKVGLIVKQDTNPFFKEILAATRRQATVDGLDLQIAFGRGDADNLSQVIAMTTMVRSGAKGILITPVDSRRIVPEIASARRAGVTVIALDTPTEPASAVDALYATDNRKAGALIGRYARAKAAQLGLAPKIAMLDLTPGGASGELRHQGFLEGFGITAGDARIAGSAYTAGDRAQARRAMARLLRSDPDITVVYTVNEPAAFGAAAALRAAGKVPAGVVLVSVDGGCQAIRAGVRRGVIDATAQQYPEAMARAGVRALAAVGRGDPKPAGYHDTGVQLVTGAPAAGVPSRGVAYGLAHCWG